MDSVPFYSNHLTCFWIKIFFPVVLDIVWVQKWALFGFEFIPRKLPGPTNRKNVILQAGTELGPIFLDAIALTTRSPIDDSMRSASPTITYSSYINFFFNYLITKLRTFKLLMHGSPNQVALFSMESTWLTRSAIVDNPQILTASSRWYIFIKLIASNQNPIKLRIYCPFLWHSGNP